MGVGDSTAAANGPPTKIATETSKFSPTKVDTSALAGISSSDNSDDIDPLARLLLDAKEMQQLESISSYNDDGASSSSSNGAIAALQLILSTIVTMDFFFVLALFAWFLAGIFCSAVWKDDYVQIAFNNNFERITQPALGVLMIASLSDAVLKRDDDSKDGTAMM